MPLIATSYLVTPPQAQHIPMHPGDSCAMRYFISHIMDSIISPMASVPKHSC